MSDQSSDQTDAAFLREIAAYLETVADEDGSQDEERAARLREIADAIDLGGSWV